MKVVIKVRRKQGPVRDGRVLPARGDRYRVGARRLIFIGWSIARHSGGLPLVCRADIALDGILVPMVWCSYDVSRG
jgi:hypothetical protein